METVSTIHREALKQLSALSIASLPRNASQQPDQNESLRGGLDQDISWFDLFELNVRLPVQAHA